MSLSDNDIPDLSCQADDQCLSYQTSRHRKKHRRHKTNQAKDLKKMYLKTKQKIQKIENEIKIRIDRDNKLSTESWCPVDIFLYKTPLFKGTSEYDYALFIASPHGITPFNCQLILRTIASEKKNHYYFYRNGVSPLQIEGYFDTNSGDEFVQNNVLKTCDDDEI